MGEPNFKALQFGAPAAERDISSGLKSYFIESDAYKRVDSRKKFILLGNRGTGKSAIFQILAEKVKPTGAIVLQLSPDDYSYELVSAALSKQGIGSWEKHSAFAAAWKFLILTLIMRELVRRFPKKHSTDQQAIAKFVQRTSPASPDSSIYALLEYIRRIEKVKIGPIEAGIKVQELNKLFKLAEINDLIPIIAKEAPASGIYVFVDELDRGWDASEDARSFVSGLFQATININQISDRISAYVSLRKELYDNIPVLYDDAQKYRDVIETISWDEQSLLALAAGRIRFSAGGMQGASNEDAWNKVFSDKLQYRQTKSFNYIVDRTLYRPRELIQFCSDILDASGHKFFPIDYDVISVAERAYSEARIKDISAEFRFQYPDLIGVMETFRGTSYALERTELELFCLEIVSGSKKVSDAARKWLTGQDHEYLIDALWRIGFLRAQTVGGVKGSRRSGSSYLGSHQIATLDLANSTRFQVHPMFRSYLSLKEAKS